MVRANIAVVEKIVAGKMEKFYEEVCLLEQPFIKDQTINISQLIAAKDRVSWARILRCDGLRGLRWGDAGETIAITKPAAEPKAE